MRGSSLILAAALCIAAAPAARAAKDRPPAAWKSHTQPRTQAICEAAEKLPHPAPDSAGPPPSSCDVLALYYGIGRPVDYRAVRACALHAPSRPDMDIAFGPASMLAMIFANGDGVNRDDDLALSYACAIDGAPAEMDGRIAHLVERKAQGATAKGRFDICDDITSGLMQGACAKVSSRLGAVRRDRARAQLTKRLAPPAAKAYASLQSAEDAYVEAIGRNEVDMSGTGRGAFYLEAVDGAREQFLDTLTLVLSGKPMAGSPVTYAEADAILNATYHEVQDLTADTFGTVTKPGITETQRLWLAYRDGFLAFARAAAPRVTSDGLAVLLTRQRIERLKAFLSEP